LAPDGALSQTKLHGASQISIIHTGKKRRDHAHNTFISFLALFWPREQKLFNFFFKHYFWPHEKRHKFTYAQE
jgi:hypothetical protein